MPASTRIFQTFGCTIECEGTPEIAEDTLYLGYTANGNDRDSFRLAVPEPGTLVTVRLSHLGVDDDLVVFGDVPPPLRQPKASTSSLQAADVGPDLQQRSQAVIPEVLGDVPVTPPAGQGVLGVSDNRGLADEEVTFVVPEDADGWINIQITSFDGAYSNEPWMLRVETSPPIELPPGCKTPVALGGGTTRALPASSAATRSTSSTRSATETSTETRTRPRLWNKLQTLAARTDAAGGTVIPVDAIPGMGATLGAWQANPCSPGLNNDVVRALGTYLDGITAAYKYIVIVGDWTVLPAGLVLDNTLYANERDYASTFFGVENTQYLSSYALGYLPTDDPYGDTSYSGQGAYIPEVAVGRLVESHSEIMGQLDQYLTRNGAIDPATGLVTGYDFLSDGASAVSDGLTANVAAPTELINDVWSKDDLARGDVPGLEPAGDRRGQRALRPLPRPACRSERGGNRGEPVHDRRSAIHAGPARDHHRLPLGHARLRPPRRSRTGTRLGPELRREGSDRLRRAEHVRTGRDGRRRLLREAAGAAGGAAGRLADGRTGARLRQAGVLVDAVDGWLRRQGDRRVGALRPADVPRRHRGLRPAAASRCRSRRIRQRASTRPASTCRRRSPR